MSARVDAIHSSAHRNQNCTDCHEAGMATKLRHVRTHILRGAPEEIHLREADIEPMMAKCQGCQAEASRAVRMTAQAAATPSSRNR